MKTLRLDDVAGVPVFGTLVWKPIRRTLGVTAFGINAYTAAKAGDEVVEQLVKCTPEHQERAREDADFASLGLSG